MKQAKPLPKKRIPKPPYGKSLGRQLYDIWRGLKTADPSAVSIMRPRHPDDRGYFVLQAAANATGRATKIETTSSPITWATTSFTQNLVITDAKDLTVKQSLQSGHVITVGPSICNTWLKKFALSVLHWLPLGDERIIAYYAQGQLNKCSELIRQANPYGLNFSSDLSALQTALHALQSEVNVLEWCKASPLFDLARNPRVKLERTTSTTRWLWVKSYLDRKALNMLQNLVIQRSHSLYDVRVPPTVQR